MIKRLLLVFTLGLGLGAGGMLVAFPFLFPPAPLDEPAPLAEADAPRLWLAAPAAMVAPRVAGGTFDREAPGRDPIHWADGTVSVHRGGDGRLTLRLEGDFRAGPGPRFVIYLNTRAVGEERDFLADRGRRAVAPLRAFRGAQNYALPPGTDIAAVHTVTIWCESFGVYIGSAALTPAA